MTGILHGVRVLEIGRMPEGAHCTVMLADHGAEVILIEAPGGDRAGHPDTLNRGKKSVLLDLETAEGMAAFRALAATADILVESLPAGVMARLGLACEDLAEINPALVHAAIRGETAEPPASGPTMAFGIMAALRHAEATGKGQRVDMTTALRFSACPAPAPQASPSIGADTDHYLSEMPHEPMSDVDKRALRDVFGAFATGVTVVTTLQPDGTPRGFTANSFSSVSLDPPLLLLCIAKAAHSCVTFAEAPHFAVNVLSEDQKPLSGLFASQAPDKFDHAPWQPGTAGMPLLDGALASLACSRERVMDAGDHLILLGRVIDHQTSDGMPLGYFKGRYFSIGLEDRLVSAASQAGAVRIGALVMRGNQILLAVGSDGQISVPRADTSRQTLPALKRHLEKLGVKAQLDFLYAVYHDTTQGHHGIYYHGTAVGLAPAGHRFFELEDIPLKKVQDPAERSMLARFYEEFRHGSFGIYQGDETSGIVQKVSAPEKSRY